MTADASYPPAPWDMTGDLFMSLFKFAGNDDRPAGTYGVAFVEYVEPSPLTYHELLVARLVTCPDGVKRVNITDIWVDSPGSMVGGNELWAIPKDLADFTHTTRVGVVTRTSLTATYQGTPIASATFKDTARFAPRTRFKGETWQQRANGDEVTAALVGGARSMLARGSWEFNPEGPLGWLAGARKLASARQADFTMSFG